MAKARFYCLSCDWNGPVPGKNKTCKRCGGATEKRDEMTSYGVEEMDTVNVLQSRHMIRTETPKICPYTDLPYEDILRDNPVVRKYKTPELHYGLIFRNKERQVEIRCPNCNKLISTNAKIEGQYDIVCKNKVSAENGGGKCGARVTIVFYRQQFKEVNRDKPRIERPVQTRDGARRPELA